MSLIQTGNESSISVILLSSGKRQSNIKEKGHLVLIAIKKNT